MLATVDVSSETADSSNSIDTNGFNSLGQITQAAVSPDGTLYATSASRDELFEIDPSGPTVTSSTSVGVGVKGADITFAADGTLYLYTMTDENLYTVDLSDGSVTYVRSVGKQLTGLAMREQGSGDFVGSIAQSDTIVTFEEGGSGVTEFTLEGDLDLHRYGDMTSGILECSVANKFYTIHPYTGYESGERYLIGFNPSPDDGNIEAASVTQLSGSGLKDLSGNVVGTLAFTPDGALYIVDSTDGQLFNVSTVQGMSN